jgi:hypothetical protein
MLKVNADVDGRDYVDYFVPFIGYVLNTHNPNPVTASVVQSHLKQDFGLAIPLHAIEFALRRLSDLKYIRREITSTRSQSRTPRRTSPHGATRFERSTLMSSSHFAPSPRRNTTSHGRQTTLKTLCCHTSEDFRSSA